MKIMIVNTYYYPEIVGGAEYSVKKLAEALQNSGQEVVVLCTGNENIREFVNGVDVIRIRTNVLCRAINRSNASSFQKLTGRIREIWNNENGKIVASVLLQEKPDVIHTNGLYDISPVIWKEASKQGIRVIHTLRDYFLCCPRVAMECESSEEKCRFKNNLCLVQRSVNKKSVKKYVDVLTAPSSVTLNKVVSTIGLQEIPKRVIPNAIDYDLSEVKRICKEKQARRPSAVKFVYLGTLSEKKGVRWMLDSFKKVENMNTDLYIAGKGELERVVRDYCSTDSRIHFVGFLNEPEMNKLLKATDVLICPSLWEEPFGRVVLDAYKHAMPVIASDKGALPEIVENGKTGTIVKSGDVCELIRAINSYIDDYGLVNSHSNNAVFELKKYSLEYQATQFVERVYTEMPINED